jgi:hypothetical protein
MERQRDHHGTEVVSCLKRLLPEICPCRIGSRICMAERVGFSSQRFAKLFAVKDMPQNAVFTAISLYHICHIRHTEILN